MRLKIVGNHPRAHGAECVIFGYVKAHGDGFAQVGSETRDGADAGISAFGRWENRPMRPSLGPEIASALVGTQGGGDYCHMAGRLVVLSHSWSGRLQINNVDRKYSVDLYSEKTRLVLLDLVAEIMVDVSGFAFYENDALRLPDLTREVILRAIVDDRAWFRFLEPDADFKPGLLRRALGWGLPRTAAFKLQIVSRLLPELAARPAPPAPVAPDAVGRDELRLLAAAVEGLALRAPIEA